MPFNRSHNPLYQKCESPTKKVLPSFPTKAHPIDTKKKKKKKGAYQVIFDKFSSFFLDLTNYERACLHFLGH